MPSEPTEDLTAQADLNAQWRAERSANARHLADELARRQRRESEQASALLADFVDQAQQQGIAPVTLHARSYNGRSRYRTKVLGWYLKMNESLAVDTAANFYILTVDSSVRNRIMGAEITPSAPPLVLGKGGRDGESLDLAEAIDRILHPERY